MGYTLYRKDRSNQAYGGVLIAVRRELVSSACPDLDTDCELLWVQIDLTGAKSLHIGASYRPPDSDVTTLENLNQSLQRLTHRTNGNIWLGGDFNAPHINWPLLEVTPLVTFTIVFLALLVTIFHFFHFVFNQRAFLS